MWKLLPLCFLVSCAATDHRSDNQPNQGRIVQQLDLPVTFTAAASDKQLAKKNFQTMGMQGWLNETGAWRIEGEVHHSRFLCGTYRTGVQPGKGNPECINVEWLTDVQYTPPLKHCNNVSRLHAGGGVFTGAANWFGEVSCVRIVVRCEGHC